MKVAFATADGIHIDAHFGWCPALVVYEVTAETAVEVVRHRFSPGAEDGDEDKLAPRVDALAGCVIVLAAAIGAGAQERLKARRIHAARAPDGEPIAAALERLRVLLAGSPPPWLRKALAGTAAKFDVEGEQP